MKQKEIQTTVYEASDGKQFLYEDDCKRYEERLLKLAKIQYFVVHCSPDLNETGCFTDKVAVAVNEHRWLGAESIVNMWAIEQYGYIGVSVQGYGVQRYYSIGKLTKEEYFKPQHFSKRLFLSTVNVDGMPEATNVMDKWLKKYERK